METQQNLLKEIEEQRSLTEATLGQRLLNFVIDLIGIFLFSYFCSFFLWDVSSYYFSSGEIAFDIFIFCFFFFGPIICPFIYYVFWEKVSEGRTPGKLLTRTKVVSAKGTKIGFKALLLRSLIRLIPFESFSFFNGAFWHDQWSKTKVIRID